MSAINWLKQQKLEFIKNEVFALTIAGAFRQGRKYPIYYNGKDISDSQRTNLYKFIKNILHGYETIYKNKVGDEQHIKNIEKLQTEINKNYSIILKLHFGRAQKLLNLYLKYLWALDLIPEPPHCPFDSIIIAKLKAKVPAWTKPDFQEKHYIELINLARGQFSKERLSIAEWELKTFNSRYPVGQIGSEPIVKPKI